MNVVRRPRPMVLALAAMVCAAGLVLYYQHRALAALQSQTRVILRQLSEQTAADVATEVRRTLDGPVTDTLLAVTHSELREGRMDLLAEAYRQGLHNYPQVESYFVWSKETERLAPADLEVHPVDRANRDPAEASDREVFVGPADAYEHPRICLRRQVGRFLSCLHCCFRQDRARRSPAP